MSARGVANRKGSAAPQAKIAVVVQLDAGEKQHCRGNVDTDQAPRRAIGQLLEPSACTAAGIEHVEAANIAAVMEPRTRCSSASRGFGWVS